MFKFWRHFCVHVSSFATSRNDTLREVTMLEHVPTGNLSFRENVNLTTQIPPLCCISEFLCIDVSRHKRSGNILHLHQRSLKLLMHETYCNPVYTPQMTHSWVTTGTHNFYHGLVVDVVQQRQTWLLRYSSNFF